jgi:hypothetical protein
MSEQEIERVEAEAPEVDAAAQAAPEPEPVEGEARRLGWKPKEEWRGDTSRWTDAATFVERATIRRETVAELEARLAAKDREMAERLERIERANAAALKAARERVLAEQRQAVEVGDVAKWEQLDRQRAEFDAVPAKPADEPKSAAQQMPAETQEWMRRNTWFTDDDVMRAAAIALADKAAKTGAGVQAQLAYVDAEMAKRFPQVRPAARSGAPAVDPGGFAGARPRAKGWDDIPAEDRKAARMFIEDGTLTKEQYAKDYWAMGA